MDALLEYEAPEARVRRSGQTRSVPAEELGLEIRSKEGITRDGGEPPFDHAGLVRQLFSEDVLEAGYNTELIDVGDNMSVVARVENYQEAQQQPIEEVAGRIRDILTRQQTREALQARANSVLESLRSGQDLAALELGEWTSYIDQGRADPSLNPGLLSTVFSMGRPDGETVYDTSLAGDSATVIALDAVNPGSVDRESQDYQQLTGFLSTISGQQEYAAYQQYLRNRAEVERP